MDVEEAPVAAVGAFEAAFAETVPPQQFPGFFFGGDFGEEPRDGDFFVVHVVGGRP